MPIRLDTDDNRVFTENRSQAQEVVASVAANFKHSLDLKASHHLLESGYTHVPVYDVPIAVLIAKPTHPDP
jgi:hypothetical protein